MSAKDPTPAKAAEVPRAPVAGSAASTSPPGLLPPPRTRLPPFVRKVPVPRSTAPVAGAMTTFSLPLVTLMPALPLNSTLLGAVTVQVLSPPVVLAMPARVKTRLLAVESCHWFSAGP